MGALAAMCLGLVLVGPAPVAALDRWSRPIAEASARFGIPEGWIRRVMMAESGGSTTLDGRPIESPAGALGLMQLMPGTWRELSEAHDLGSDPHDPRDNILAGTAYLRAMYDRFGYPGLFAAYHAGPGRYADHVATGRGLPPETVAYVAAVTASAREARPVSSVRSAPVFFVVGSKSAGTSGGTALSPSEDGLFVRLGGAGTTADQADNRLKEGGKAR